MVSIILTILKIVGISLLALLGIVILLILLVLFVPVRYKAGGSYAEGNADVSGKVRWLLGIVSVKVRYQNGQPFHIKAKVLFITIFDNLKKGKKPKRERKRKRTSDEKPQIQAASSDEEGHAEEENIPEEVFVDEAAMSEAQWTADEVEKDKADDETAGKISIIHKIKAFFAKLVEILENIKFTFHRIYDIMVKVRDNIKYYWELLQEESTKEAFGLCSKRLLKIIKNISPRKYEVKLHLGFEDPAVMGNVLAVWGMLYPFHMGKVDIEPEFDKTVMEGSFRLRGRMSIHILLWTVWLFVTDKNIRQLRKQLGI